MPMAAICMASQASMMTKAKVTLTNAKMKIKRQNLWRLVLHERGKNKIVYIIIFIFLKKMGLSPSEGTSATGAAPIKLKPKWTITQFGSESEGIPNYGSACPRVNHWTWCYNTLDCYKKRALRLANHQEFISNFSIYLICYVCLCAFLNKYNLEKLEHRLFQVALSRWRQR